MLKDRRRLWTYLLFICFFAPFLVLLAVSWLSPTLSKPLSPLAGAPPAASNTGGAAAGGDGGVAGGTHPEAGSVPLLAAGDGRDVWVALPAMSETKIPGFELLNHPANAATWKVAARNGTQTFWSGQGFPRALMLMLPPPSNPFVIGENGWMYQYSLEGNDPRDSLPPSHIVKAAIGGQSQLFVVTLGVPLATTTRPGDRVHGELQRTGEASGAEVSQRENASVSTAASSPAGRRAAESQPASGAVERAATSTAPPAPPSVASSSDLFNTYWFPPPPNRMATTAGSFPAPPGPGATAVADVLSPTPGTWAYLAPLGAPGAPGMPTPSSLMALAVKGQTLMVLWVDPLHNRDLCVRTLRYTSRAAQWSEVITTHLPEGEVIPAPESRLLTLMLDQTLYVLWTVPTGASVALHGGWMQTDPQMAGAYTIPAQNLLKEMSLGVAGQGISPSADVAVGATENSILALAMGKDGALSSLLFDNRGHLLSGPVAVEPHLPPRELQIGQNVAMVLLVLILTLSLWQWRQKPVPLALPSGMIVAPLHLRAAAFLIDAVVPYVVVLMIFGTGENGGWFSLMGSWIEDLARPDELVKSVELFAFLGIYLAHVTAGELFFRRSIGKAIVGLQVLMLDGKAPTLAAILLRNLIRLPEMAVGIVILYVLISERHQRLGDLLARTLVVAHKSPETPADPDGESPRK